MYNELYLDIFIIITFVIFRFMVWTHKLICNYLYTDRQVPFAPFRFLLE